MNPVLSENFDPVQFNMTLPVFPADPGYLRGFASEEKAYKAARRIKALGEKLKGLRIPRIVGVLWARGNYFLQRRGIDLVFLLEDGNELPAQIKSSERGAQRFERKHKFRQAKGWFNVLAKAIVVDPLEDTWVTINKLIEYLNEAYATIKHHLNMIEERRVAQARRRHLATHARKQFRFLHKSQQCYNSCRC